MNIIQQLDKEHIEKLGKTIPDFQPGDTVIVNVKVKEGERSRVQAYEGVCIARSGAGFQESFTVRKISYGEGVERVFPVYSPNIDSIKVVRRGLVRRAKLYYLRDRRGKSARIAERVDRQDRPRAPRARPRQPPSNFSRSESLQRLKKRGSQPRFFACRACIRAWRGAKFNCAGEPDPLCDDVSGLRRRGIFSRMAQTR